MGCCFFIASHPFVIVHRRARAQQGEQALGLVRRDCYVYRPRLLQRGAVAACYLCVGEWRGMVLLSRWASVRKLSACSTIK